MPAVLLLTPHPVVAAQSSVLKPAAVFRRSCSFALWSVWPDRKYQCCGVQEPVPEITALRRGDSWRSQQLYIYPDESTPLEGVVGSALDIEIVLER